MVRQYWREHFCSRGALLHEVPLFHLGRTPLLDGRCPQRWTDAVLLPDYPDSVELTFRRTRALTELGVVGLDTREQSQWFARLGDARVVVIQAKERQLGPNVLGQTVCSAALISVWQPKSIEPVALVTREDDELLCATRKVEGLASRDSEQESWFSGQMRAHHQRELEALVKAFVTLRVERVNDPRRPYVTSPETHPVDDDLDRWCASKLAPAVEPQRVALGASIKPLAVERQDKGMFFIHSHGRSSGTPAAMTLPLVGHAVLGQALIRSSGQSVRTVIAASKVNPGIVPLLVAFPWIEVAVRLPKPRFGTAGLFMPVLDPGRL